MNTACSVEAATIDFRTADFDILDAKLKPIGNVHFNVSEPTLTAQLVSSEAQYLTGDYDIERDTFDTASSGPPRMTRYSHAFFHSSGAPFLTSQVDFSSGYASCTTYPEGKPVVASATFHFPRDSYAGAAMVLPLQSSLRQDVRRRVVMTDFACAPSPRLIKVEVQALPPARWNNFPSRVIRTDIKPDFGWLNYVLAPFMPEMHAWFDPGDGLQLVGAQFSRYYRGPEIILRRKSSGPHVEAPRAGTSATRAR